MTESQDRVEKELADPKKKLLNIMNWDLFTRVCDRDDIDHLVT